MGKSILKEKNVKRADAVNLTVDWTSLKDFPWARTACAHRVVRKRYATVYKTRFIFLLPRAYIHNAKLRVDRLYSNSIFPANTRTHADCLWAGL